MKITKILLALGVFGAFAFSASAAELKYVLHVGDKEQDLKKLFKQWEDKTGNTVKIIPAVDDYNDRFAQIRLWLSSQASNVDLYQVDVTWAGSLAKHLVDLKQDAKYVAPLHFKSVIESQTSDGRLIALPLYTDAPAMFYRKDLLAKYNKRVPTTWKEFTETAQYIQDEERKAGNDKMWGFTFQGRVGSLSYNGLEWVHSYGGGSIVESDGTISINNQNTIDALKMVKSWIGTIAPKGVLAYAEEESRAVWQNGNAVFHRQWPYAYFLGAMDGSPIKGKFGVANIPGKNEGQSAHTLGGWNIAVSKYSKNVDAAKSFAVWLAQPEIQKQYVMLRGDLPTALSLYEDADVRAKIPWVVDWKAFFLKAVPRPSAPTKTKYNEVAGKFSTAVHNAISGNGSVEENIELLEAQLIKLKGRGWE